MDTASQWSRETDPVRQGEARSTAFGTAARIYGECTASNEGGRIYKETTLIGSHSRLFVCCPHCSKWLYPERDQLRGWQDAETVGQAHRQAAYVCQHCGTAWSEQGRAAALAQVRLVHRGQEISDDGIVTGDAPDTFTLGVVWNAMHSSLVTMGMIGEKEWLAENGLLTDQGARREVIQFWWAMPDREAENSIELSFHHLAQRVGDFHFDPRGALSTDPANKSDLPDGPAFYVGAVDVQKSVLYVTLDGFDRDLTRWTVFWAVINVVPEESPGEPTEGQLRRALDEARRMIMDVYGAASMWVDCGYKFAGFQDHVVKTWCHEQGDGVNALVGRSASQQARLSGKAREIPPGVPADIVQCRLQDDGSVLWFLAVDKIKDEVHSRLFRSPGSPGCHWFAREAANSTRTDRSKGPGSQGWIFSHYMRVKRVIETVNGRRQRRWKEIGRYDLWDLAAYSLAGAWIALAEMSEPETASAVEHGSPIVAPGAETPRIRTQY